MSEYKDFKYNIKEKEIIENTVLTKVDINKLNEIKETILNKKFKKWKDVIFDIYKLYVYGEYMPIELAEIYNKKTRQIQTLIKECGFARSSKDSALISAKRGRKDFNMISNKSRLTLAINNQCSKPEEYTRKLLNEHLTSFLSDCHVIVGLNNRSILSGKEIDIPIVIIKDNNFYTYGVEFNGSYWHRDRIEKDKDKDEKAKSLGYKLFTITQEIGINESKLKDHIYEEVVCIGKEIKDDINNKLNKKETGR